MFQTLLQYMGSCPLYSHSSRRLHFSKANFQLEGKTLQKMLMRRVISAYIPVIRAPMMKINEI